jgi:radical SAM superfamily enzyme YgiQ (UPF0313 family)
MRILLINPYYPISETPSPPLGLAYLAAALEQAGARVKLLDYVVQPYSQSRLEAVVNNFKPQLAGATAVTMTFDHASKVLKDLKMIDPEILCVLGGPHVSFRARETLEEIPELDVVVLGEGEQTLVDLMRSLESNRDLKGVNGIAFRRGAEISTTPARRFIAKLDNLPMPARHLLPLGRYRALGLPATLTTSRGCPYRCIFCVGRKMGGTKVRYHSADRVATELAYLASRRFERINIADDLFTANPDHCLAVCQAILDRNLTINWTAFARVDTVSEKLLIQMKAAGCSAVSLKNIQAGKASDDEVDQFENLERTVLIYELMMNNIIEENGVWPHRGPPQNADKNLKLLIDRIVSVQKVDPKMLELTLMHTVANGNLNCQWKADRVKWQWQDYL